MDDRHRLSTRATVAWVVALTVLPVASAGTIFGLTDDGLVRGENSALAQRYTAVPAETTPATTDLPLPARFGTPGGAETLVIYDDTGEYADDAELYAVAAANLATHFGEAEIVALADYPVDRVEDFDAVVYLGTDDGATLPREFVADVRSGDVPVLWVQGNVDELASGAPNFVGQYGWDPLRPSMVESSLVESVSYRDHRVVRYAGGTDVLRPPRVVDESAVEVLATALCGSAGQPLACSEIDPRVTQVPWAVRSDNLTYVSEIPLDYIDDNDVYLIFADLYYDLLAPGTAPVKQAAVRLEDVGPEANPKQLRAVADLLHDEGVPFQVAVVPIHIDRTPDGHGWYGLSLLDTPEVVKALAYMQRRGGTLVQHGTTHQHGAFDNPYSGRSGEDYEFYRYGCSDTPSPPYDFGACQNDSYIRPIGPVSQDSVADQVARLRQGRQIMIDAGLGQPTIFETPHYAASVNAYLAMSQLYDARYEQSDYYAGIVSGRDLSADSSLSQPFPYTVHDIYGSTVYPENLGNITEAGQNGNPVRTPEFIVGRAEANLVVRESTASFFFHPYLDLDQLQRTVKGIRDLGYVFVPADKLR